MQQGEEGEPIQGPVAQVSTSQHYGTSQPPSLAVSALGEPRANLPRLVCPGSPAKPGWSPRHQPSAEMKQIPLGPGLPSPTGDSGTEKPSWACGAERQEGQRPPFLGLWGRGEQISSLLGWGRAGNGQRQLPAGCGAEAAPCGCVGQRGVLGQRQLPAGFVGQRGEGAEAAPCGGVGQRG